LRLVRKIHSNRNDRSVVTKEDGIIELLMHILLNFWNSWLCLVSREIDSGEYSLSIMPLHTVDNASVVAYFLMIILVLCE